MKKSRVWESKFVLIIPVKFEAKVDTYTRHASLGKIETS